MENILLDNGSYDLTPPGMRSVKEYFEIFDDKARHQRRQMTLSVIRRLKKTYLTGNAYPDMEQDLKKEYRNKINTHLDFTKKDRVTSARISTVSFFLAAIPAYIEAHPINSDIISFLTRSEYENRKKNLWIESHHSLETLLSDPSQDAWKIFRYHALAMVHRPVGKDVDEFLSSCPAAFHPKKDIFILAARAN